MLSRNLIRNSSALIIGAVFVNIGIDHFFNPEWYEPIVPEILGHPRFWVLFSGGFEIIFGIFLIIPKTRRNAAYLGIILLAVLYLANFNMWINDIPLDNKNYSDEWHVIRLVIQITLIIFVAWIGDIIPRGDNNNIA